MTAKNGKKLFIESLERSPMGSSSDDALKGLREANAILGVSNPDDGRPGVDSKPLDPYAGDGSDTKPLDPYAGDGGDAKPLDPYDQGSGDTGVPDDEPVGDEDEPNTETSRGLMAWGAGYGFTLGMAIGGPTDEFDDVRGSALLLGLVGIGGGIAGGYFSSRRYPLSRGQVSAIASAGNWGMWNFAFLGDVFTGESTEVNDVYKFIAAGGLLGAGAGILWAKKMTPSEGQVAVVNSFGAYGTSAGLLIGVGIDPPRSEAYSINAVLGSAGGLAVGLWAGSKLEMSRARTLRIDLGAAVGVAATWALIYPLISDDVSNNDEQFAGWFSTLTMAGGIGVAYYLTREFDEKRSSASALGKTTKKDRYPTPMGLVRRSNAGQWSLGSPLLRPMSSPGATRSGIDSSGFSLGVDVAAGYW